MAEDMNDDNQVVAFLEHLTQQKLASDHVQNALLKTIVEFARDNGYDFSAEDFMSTVDVHVYYGVTAFLRWPITH